MRQQKKDIWIGLDQNGQKLPGDDKRIVSKNLVDHIFNFTGLNSNRRNFFKTLGLGTTALALSSACKRSPIKKGMPLFSNSSSPKPGEELWYATTCAVCMAHCPLTVKTVDYRPIKIEGNKNSKRTNGGVCASAHASLLDLYNSERLKNPEKNKLAASWNEIDREIIQKLQLIKQSKKEIAIVMPYSNSPASTQLLKEFKDHYPSTKIYYSNLFAPQKTFDAYHSIFGKAIFPDHRFQKARLLVSFGADFLGNWLSPIEYTNAYLAKRDIDNTRNLSYHIQFESHFSITGASADKRCIIKPAEEGIILAYLYQYIREPKLYPEFDKLNSKYQLKQLADKLRSNKGRSILLSASNNLNNQKLIIGINSILGNMGRSIDLDNPLIKQDIGSFDVQLLKSKISDKQIGGLICWNDDLLKDEQKDSEISRALTSIELKISLNLFKDKFSKYADYLCPDHHFLESWNNYSSKGILQTSQATINPIMKSRQAQESFLIWMEHTDNWLDYLEKSSLSYIGVDQNKPIQFNDVVKAGIWTSSSKIVKKYNFKHYLDPVIKIIKDDFKKSTKLEIVFCESQGQKSYTSHLNSFLAEYVDPITSGSWKIYAQISPDTAKQYKISQGQIIKIISNKHEINLPCIVQAGIADSCIVIPVGKMASALNEGNNPLLLLNDSNSDQFSFSIEGLNQFEEVCQTQTHTKVSTEAIVPELSLISYLAKKASHNSEDIPTSVLSKKRDFKPHHWAMVVDLNKCTACGSCSISCQAENNIPVIGAEEIKKGRSMSWMKVQRFYSGEVEHPMLHFLPMMCQQCDQAPCESVCPVSAVSSSNEGLNQQNYNRCIGARFCATNCPYLSRTFNYNNYSHQNPNSPHMSDELGRLMLNPSVSVREAGTAEKCTFCVQRIQQAKAKAKQDDTPLKDGSIQTACQQSCPAQAIYFGDMNDKGSMVYNLSKNKRAHVLLPALGTQPSVYYLSKVRNTDMDL